MRVTVIGVVGLALSALAGCHEQNTAAPPPAASAGVGVTAADGTGAPATASSPCRSPWGSGPFEPTPTPLTGGVSAQVRRAVGDHGGGCAGVRFHIGRDGTPQDVEVLVVNPVASFIGVAAREAVASTRWPASGGMAWYYVVFTVPATLG